MVCDFNSYFGLTGTARFVHFACFVYFVYVLWGGCLEYGLNLQLEESSRK